MSPNSSIELTRPRVRSVIVVGSRQPARVHALAHALNGALGNAGHTVNYFPVADPLDTDPTAAIKQLATDMEKGTVGTLVILGGNPAYDAPGDLKLAERIKLLKPYKVTADVMHMTGRTDSIFLHCLPSFHDMSTEYARRHPDICEVSDDVFESAQSRVFDQAENRMHTAKALMIATI